MRLNVYTLKPKKHSRLENHRELANLCILMASMSKHLASNWKTFFDIADPSHAILPAKTAPTPAPAFSPLADDLSMDEYDYATETDDDETTSTQSDAAFDGTTIAEATSRLDSGSAQPPARQTGSKRACHDEATRTVRRRHDDYDDDVCGGGDDGPSHSGTGSQGSTAFGSFATSRGGSSSAAPAGSASRGGNTHTRAISPPTMNVADHKLAKPAVAEQGLTLRLSSAAMDREFGCFFAQQFAGVRCC